MADPESDSLIKPHFFQPLLPGFHSFLNIPAKFFNKLIEGRSKNKRVELRSDVSYKTWKVKMEGRRFTDGWKEFAADHDFRIGDFVVFRHEGDLVFHVTGFGPSLCNLKYESPSPNNNNSDEHNIGNGSRKKKKKDEKKGNTKTDHTCLEVTASNLRLDRRFVPMRFVRANGLDNRRCEIEFMNERGRSWNLDLRWRKKDGHVYIGRGWRRFCRANGLAAGSFCKLKMVRNGFKPVLQLCQTDNANSHEEGFEANESNSHSTKPNRRGKSCSRGRSRRSSLPLRDSISSGQNRFVILHLTPYVYRTGQLRLPTRFTRLNGIKESRAATLLDKYGVEWSSYLHSVKGWHWFYMRRSCRDFCKANGVKEGESFMLELIWRDTTPIFRFCSEIHQESLEPEENQTETKAGVYALKRRICEIVQPLRTEEEFQTETEINRHKRVRVQGCNNPDPDHENRSKQREDQRLINTQESSGGTQSEPMAKAKQSITDALTAIREFREVLITKEQNLEALLRKLQAMSMSLTTKEC